MGGCVASLMNYRNQATLVPDEMIENLKAYGPLSLPVPGTATDHSTAVYRNGHQASDVAYHNACRQGRAGPNVVARFAQTCEQLADNPAIAFRPIVKRQKENISTNDTPRWMEVTYLGKTQHITLRYMWQMIEHFGRGLGELGIPPRSHVSIYEETCWQWLASIYGIWLRDLVASTVYANLGEDALFYALRETESKAIVCNGYNVPNLLRGVAENAFAACTIIYLGELPATGCDAPGSCRVIAWDDVVQLGKSSGGKHKLSTPSNEDDVALIMYTSGTTGNPKGVVHTHVSIACGVRSMEIFLDSLLPRSTHEVYCAYLPLAHILEFGVVNVFLGRGATVGFGSPRTLTDATARPHGDLTEYKPMVLVAVPRVFDTVKKAVEAKLPPVGSLKRTVFDRAYQSRLQALKEGKDTPYWNEKVFNKIRAALGGHTRLLLSGGGPLSAATQEWVNVVLGHIVIGWGLTETICVGAIQRLGDLEPNCAGQVLSMEELKLVDVEEFKHTDKPEPRGEICLRGPFLFKGYYKQPELTREALDAGGWFHTGDVGSITSSGKVRIVGRVKALAKNALGEYIALEALETIYSNHPLVADNCACVLVHPDRNYIAVLAVTDEARVRRFAAEHNIAGEFPQVMHSADFRKAAAESLAAMGAAAKRKPFEQPRAVHFVTDAWTPENGVLTAAMKLKRRVIDEKYGDVIKALFANEERQTVASQLHDGVKRM